MKRTLQYSLCVIWLLWPLVTYAQTPTPVPDPIYRQTLLEDDFSGASIDSAKWTGIQGTVTQTGGKLAFTPGSNAANSSYIGSVAKWARTDGNPGIVLRATWSETQPDATTTNDSYYSTTG